MPRARRVDPFFIVVTDEDEQIFNVLGPMIDDTSIIDKVIQCQAQGRKVTCHTAGHGQSREQIVASYSHEAGFYYSAKAIAT